MNPFIREAIPLVFGVSKRLIPNLSVQSFYNYAMKKLSPAILVRDMQKEFGLDIIDPTKYFKRYIPHSVSARKLVNLIMKMDIEKGLPIPNERASVVSDKVIPDIRGEQQEEEKAYKPEQLPEQMAKTLELLKDNILRFIAVNIPIDTGRMFSSLYVTATSDTTLEIGIDTKSAPYAPWVEILPNKHPNGGIAHFMEQSARSAILITPCSDVFNVSVECEPNNVEPRLAIVINGRDDNISRYIKPDEEYAKVNNVRSELDQFDTRFFDLMSKSNGRPENVIAAFQTRRYYKTNKQQFGLSDAARMSLTSEDKLSKAEALAKYTIHDKFDAATKLADSLNYDPRRFLIGLAKDTLPKNFLDVLRQAE